MPTPEEADKMTRDEQSLALAFVDVLQKRDPHPAVALSALSRVLVGAILVAPGEPQSLLDEFNAYARRTLFEGARQ